MKCPAEIYSTSPRPYNGLPELTYPLHDRDLLVTACGRLRRPCWPVKGSGIKEVAGQLYDFRPRLLRSGAENFAANRQPLRPKVVTHVLGTFCYLCVRAGHAYPWRRRRDSNPR